MSPVCSRPNAADRADGNPIASRKLAVAKRRTGQNFHHFCVGQFRPCGCLSARLVARRYLVGNVLVVRAPVQMARVHTRRAIASVESVRAVAWRLAMGANAHRTVGADAFGDSAATAGGMLPVPLLPQQKGPKNAIICRATEGHFYECRLRSCGSFDGVKSPSFIQSLIVRTAITVRQMLLAAIRNRTYALSSQGCLHKGSTVRRGSSASNTPCAVQNLTRNNSSATVGGINAH